MTKEEFIANIVSDLIAELSARSAFGNVWAVTSSSAREELISRFESVIRDNLNKKMVRDQASGKAASPSKIVSDLIEDLKKRHGLSEEWDRIHPDVQESLISKWERIVESNLQDPAMMDSCAHV